MCYERIEQSDRSTGNALRQFIIHVRESGNGPEAEIERGYLLAFLEDLVRLKGERERLEDEMALELAA